MSREIRELLQLYMNFQSGKITIRDKKWNLEDFAQYIAEFAEQKLHSSQEVTEYLCSHRSLKNKDLADEFSQRLVDYLNESYPRHITSYQVTERNGITEIHLTVRYRRFVRVQNLLLRYTKFALPENMRMRFRAEEYTLPNYTKMIVDFSRKKSPKESAHETETIFALNEDHCLHRFQMTNIGVFLVSELNRNNNQNVLDYEIKRSTAGKQELFLVRSDRRWLKKNRPQVLPEDTDGDSSDAGTDVYRLSATMTDIGAVLLTLKKRLSILETFHFDVL